MMKVILLALMILTQTPVVLAQAAFEIELSSTRIKVMSPQKEEDPVSVVVKNNTELKVHSELRSQDKVLSRFVVPASGSKSLQVKLPADKRLYYVTVSPPSQAVELKFNQRDYEVPEKQ